MPMDFYRMTKNFLIGEANKSPTVNSHIQMLGEIIDNFKTRTKLDENRLLVAKQQLREIRKHVTKIHERINILEEQVNLLEEEKNL